MDLDHLYPPQIVKAVQDEPLEDTASVVQIHQLISAAHQSTQSTQVRQLHTFFDELNVE